MKLFRLGLALLTLSASFSHGSRSFGEPPPETHNLWELRLPGPFNSSVSTPAIAPDGTVYLGTFYGSLVAVTPEGDIKWTFNVNCEIKSSPAIANDGTVYFGSRNRNFYALTPAGKMKWMFSTGGWVDSSPAIARDGTVYFGSADKNVYALNPDGSEKWKFAVGAIVNSSPAIATDGTIYFGAHNKKFYALDPGGKVQWTFLTGSEIISSPAISANGTIYFSSLDGNLYALKMNGLELWHCHTGSAWESSPVTDGSGNIYLRANSSVISISPEGQKRWDQGTPFWLDETPAVAGDWIYCSMNWHIFGALTPDHRGPWKANLGESGFITASPVIGSNGIIYAASGLYLQAFHPPGPELGPAKSSWPMFRANPRHTGRVGD
jgi:outer membrane protein assembly factor BamB